jgi:acyl carrier protein
MEESQEIKDTVKRYLIDEYLPGEDPDALTDSLPLITGGILDSISTVKLVSFLEERYGIRFQAHEMSADHLDTLARITNTVRSRLVRK